MILTFRRLAEALEEATLGGNAGAFPVPLGPVLTREPWNKDRPDRLPEVAYEIPEAYRELLRR